MNLFVEQLLLAFGGYLFHLLKQYGESIKRKETFVNKMLYVSAGMNVLSIVILIYIGNKLPNDLIVMSPLTCVIIGSFGASMLSGFINIKKPTSIEVTDTEKVTVTDSKTLTVEPDPVKIDAAKMAKDQELGKQ